MSNTTDINSGRLVRMTDSTGDFWVDYDDMLADISTRFNCSVSAVVQDSGSKAHDNYLWIGDHVKVVSGRYNGRSGRFLTLIGRDMFGKHPATALLKPADGGISFWVDISDLAT